MTCVADFGQNVLWFPVRGFFPCGGNSFNLQGLISTTRGKFEPHLFAIWRHRGVKNGSNKIVLPNYVKGAIKPLGKICKMQKID